MKSSVHKRMSFFNPEGTLEKKGHNHSFTFPVLSDIPIKIDCQELKLSLENERFIQEANNNPLSKAIFADIGKTYYDGITAVPRVPAKVAHKEIDDLSQKIASIGPGVIDMKIKSSGVDEIFVPCEFEPLIDIIKTSASIEKELNHEFVDWNMWLLVDRRPVVAGLPQRNGGAHCDGFRMNDPTLQQTSVYTWCNTLPTEATVATFPIPTYFDPMKHNFSSLLTRDWDESTTVTTVPNYVYRMDGHTPHRGKVSDCAIDNRVFIRVCCTPKDKEFNRKGNTPNPCLPYPDDYWVTVVDPASRYENITDFDTPDQFIRMWKNACQGHASYGIVGSGLHSHEHQLVTKLKGQSPTMQYGIFKQYEEQIQGMKEQNQRVEMVEMEEMRLDLLKHKVF